MINKTDNILILMEVMFLQDKTKTYSLSKKKNIISGYDHGYDQLLRAKKEIQGDVINI